MNKLAILALVCGLAASAAEAVECFTPREWQPKLMRTVMDDDGNFIHDALDALSPDDLVDVVVDLNRCATDADVARFEAFGEVALVGEFLSFVVLQQVAVGDLGALVEDRQVAFVEAEPEMAPMLEISRQVVGADRIPVDYGHDGSGVTIAVIDTGVDDGTHVGLPSTMFKGGIDCTTTPPTCDPTINPDDFASFGGHGTAVAGVALGRGGGNCPGCVGMAPAADLVDVKVFDLGVPILPAVLGGMQGVLRHKKFALEIDVVNMSFANCLTSDGTDVFSKLANLMVKHGMVVVTAGGNTVNCGNISTPNANVVPAPAAADNVIAVANANDYDTVGIADDAIWYSSLTGPRIPDGDLDVLDEQKPELAAPGTAILTPAADSATAYALHTGTSMAAPHAAGCAALVLDANPTMPPLSVKQLLIDSARDLGSAGWDGFWGNGLLDCYGAIDDLEQTDGTDLMFEVWDCRPGSPPCWKTPNLHTANPTIQEHKPNTIVAEVYNAGPEPATNFLVTLGVYNFGNGDMDYPICVKSYPAVLGVGQTAVFSCPYTPQLSGSSPAYVQASLKAEIVYPFDMDFANNRARRSVNIGQTTVTLAFPVELANPTVSLQTIRLDLAEACCDGSAGADCACAGWELRSSVDQVVMAPDDPSQPVILELEPVDPDALPQAEFDVTMIGTDPSGAETMLNGVTVMARLDCGITDLSWTDKRTLGWTGSAFSACGDSFDVARGPLPVTTGDLSGAECLADDFAEPAFEDPDVPDPGTGFYYLLRTNQGSWNNGTEFYDRDAALRICG